MTTNHSDINQPSSPPVMLPLPIHRVVFTYILIAIIAIIWLVMLSLGGLQNGEMSRAIMIAFGANVGGLILQGQTWRLFTSMFLHWSWAHILFNLYALYVIGLDTERLYGADRFIVIYILAGLFGSLASVASRGPYVLSAGASGAIFGLIGMELAYFLIHHRAFGAFGRAQLTNIVVIIIINLFFGLTIPNIDNLAHLGGLVSGFALGYGLAPRYEVVGRYTLNPYIIDTVSLFKRWWVPALAVIVLAVGVSLSISFWTAMIK